VQFVTPREQGLARLLGVTSYYYVQMNPVISNIKLVTVSVANIEGHVLEVNYYMK
jgi:hypothetical protein